MNASNRLSATSSNQRIAVLDAWRGFALLGVCIVNFLLANDDYFSGRAAAESLVTAPFDWRMEALVSFFLRNKAHTIFSFLFGIGLAMISGRAGDAADNVLFRRLVILLIFGWAHCLLLYHGDILHRYALLGLVTVGLARLMRPAGMAATGLVLALGARVVYEERAFFLALLDVAPASVPLPEASTASSALASLAPMPEFLVANVMRVLDDLRDLPKLLFVDLYYLGRILLGFAFWQSGIARRALAMPSSAHWSLGIALLVTTALLSALRTLLPEAETGRAWHLVNNLVRHADILVLSAGYLAVAAAVVNGDRLPWLTGIFTRIGRMSLTNYVLQSIGMLLLFAPIGLGLGGRIGATVAVLLAFAFFAVQATFSSAWLARRDQGPLEWYWRRLVYGRPPEARSPDDRALN